MKKLLTLALVLFGVSALSAATVSLDWDDNPAAELVTNYIVYEDDGAGNLTAVTSSQISEVDVLNVASGVHIYVVTALNVWGEGLPSNSVSTPTTPSAPTGLTIVVIVP